MVETRSSRSRERVVEVDVSGNANGRKDRELVPPKIKKRRKNKILFKPSDGAIDTIVGGDGGVTVTVLVKAVFRYTVDKNYKGYVALRAEDFEQTVSDKEAEALYSQHHGYDFLISDGSKEMIIVVHPKLHFLIEKGILYETMMIKLDLDTDIVSKVKEDEIGCRLYLLVDITKLLFPHKIASSIVPSTNPIPSMYPVLYKHHYYLDTYIDDIASRLYQTPKEYKIDEQQNSVGLVIAKSKMNHFGKFNLEQPCPFQYSVLLLKRHKETVMATFWNSMAVHTFNRIEIGQIIRTSGHRSIQKATYKEISINPSNPNGQVEVIGKSSQLKKPFITPQPFNSLPHLVDDEPFDVIGVVVYSGTPFREFSVSNKFNMARWIVLASPESTIGLTVKIFSNSSNFDIRTGELIALTKVTLTTMNTLQTSWTTRSFICKSTFYTSILKQSECEKMVDLDVESITEFPEGWKKDLVFSFRRELTYEFISSLSKNEKPIPFQTFLEISNDIHVGQRKTVLLLARITDIERLVLTEGHADDPLRVPYWRLSFSDVNEIYPDSMQVDLVLDPLPYTSSFGEMPEDLHLQSLVRSMNPALLVDVHLGTRDATKQLINVSKALKEKSVAMAIELYRPFVTFHRPTAGSIENIPRRVEFTALTVLPLPEPTL